MRRECDSPCQRALFEILRDCRNQNQQKARCRSSFASTLSQDSGVGAASLVGEEKKRFNLQIEKADARTAGASRQARFLATGYACYIIMARCNSCAPRSDGNGISNAPSTKSAASISNPFSRSWVPSKTQQPPGLGVIATNLQITQSSFPYFAFAFSKPSLPSGLGPIIAHWPPIHANPPSSLFSCPTQASAGLSPTECL